MPSAAAIAPPVTFSAGVVRAAPLASVKRPLCTVAPPLTVSCAYHVRAGDGQVAADGQRAGHAAAGEGHVVVDPAAAQEQAALDKDAAIGQLALTASEPAGMMVVAPL